METKLQLAEEEYTMRMKMNNEITDPYMRFYCAVFNNGHDHMQVPDDYKETVLYVLNETGLADTWVDAVKHFFGLDGCKPESLKEIAEKKQASVSAIVGYLDRVYIKCWHSKYRNELLILGLKEYERQNDGMNELPVKMAEFQKQYQQLKAERLEAAKKMKNLLKAYAEENHISVEHAKRIAAKEVKDRTVTEAKDMLERFGG